MSTMTTEEMEAQTKAMEEQLAAARAKVAKKRQKSRPPRPKDGEVLAAIQQDTRVKNATLKNAHGGYAGQTLINKIEKQMDRRREVMAQMIIKQGSEARELEAYILQKGRYQGFAATLAILRSSSLDIEIARSNERLGIE